MNLKITNNTVGAMRKAAAGAGVAAVLMFSGAGVAMAEDNGSSACVNGICANAGNFTDPNTGAGSTGAGAGTGSGVNANAGNNADGKGGGSTSADAKAGGVKAHAENKAENPEDPKAPKDPKDPKGEEPKDPAPEPNQPSNPVPNNPMPNNPTPANPGDPLVKGVNVPGQSGYTPMKPGSPSVPVKGVTTGLAATGSVTENAAMAAGVALALGGGLMLYSRKKGLSLAQAFAMPVNVVPNRQAIYDAISAFDNFMGARK